MQVHSAPSTLAVHSNAYHVAQDITALAGVLTPLHAEQERPSRPTEAFLRLIV